MDTDNAKASQRRLRSALVVVGLIAVVLIAQLTRWTIWAQPTAGAREALWTPNNSAGPVGDKRRGNILDRHGALLVISGSQWEVTATPPWIDEEQSIIMARLLAPLLDLPEADLAKLLSLDKDAPWAKLEVVDYQTGVRLREFLTEAQEGKAATEEPGGEESENLADLPWYAISLTPIPVRLYPEGSLACHLLGFVNAEGKTFYGVERFYDSELRGHVPLDLSGRGVPLATLGTRFESNASPDGRYDLVLTIDRAIQNLVEQELAAAIAQFSATEGTIVVLDPKSGAILASASYPTYFPEHFAQNADAWEDPAISKPYEPGSIFKVITMAAGLNAGVIVPSSTYVDEGCTTRGEQEICNYDKIAYGKVDMMDVLKNSLNLGTIHVAFLLGAKDFYAYLVRFNIGDPLGIDVANEVGGNLRQPDDRGWYEADLGTHSFGQGLTVTPLQMAAAVGALANDGFLMQPHVVDKIIVAGRAVSVEPRAVRQVVREDTASTLTKMLVEAIDEAAPLAQVPGYSVAGKTGTAQIPTSAGYEEHEVIADFVGYLPASDPAFVILVKIVRPQGELLGGQVAAPSFSRIAQQLVAMEGIPPDRVVR